VESVSEQPASGGGGMTLQPHNGNRVHNLRIVRTISNDTDLDWQPVESKLLAAADYVAPRRSLHLRFQSGEVYRCYTFSADQYQEFLATESKGRYFLRHIRARLAGRQGAGALRGAHDR
jgi:KTSC domain